MLGVSQVPSMIKEGFATAKQFSIGPVAWSAYALPNTKGTGADWARFVGSAIITGSGFIPMAGVPLFITLGVMDANGYFNPLMNMPDQ